jgi:hypothetical protein
VVGTGGRVWRWRARGRGKGNGEVIWAGRESPGPPHVAAAGRRGVARDEGGRGLGEVLRRVGKLLLDPEAGTRAAAAAGRGDRGRGLLAHPRPLLRAGEQTLRGVVPLEGSALAPRQAQAPVVLVRDYGEGLPRARLREFPPRGRGAGLEAARRAAIAARAYLGPLGVGGGDALAGLLLRRHLEARLGRREGGGVVLRVVAALLEARGRGRGAEEGAVGALDGGEGRGLAEPRGGLGPRREEREVGPDAGRRRHQECELAARQSARDQLDVARDLDAAAPVVVLVAALGLGLEADLHLGIEPLGHVRHVMVVEGRDLLEVRDAVVEVRDESLLHRRVHVLQVIDVARDFARALGEARAELGEYRRVGGHGAAQLLPLNLLEMLDRHLQDVGLLELRVSLSHSLSPPYFLSTQMIITIARPSLAASKPC